MNKLPNPFMALGCICAESEAAALSCPAGDDVAADRFTVDIEQFLDDVMAGEQNV